MALPSLFLPLYYDHEYHESCFFFYIIGTHENCMSNFPPIILAIRTKTVVVCKYIFKLG